MPKKTILSKVQMRALWGEEFVFELFDVIQRLERLKVRFESTPISQNDLNSLFPTKKNYQLQWEGNGEISLAPCSLEDLRQRAKDLRVDISDLGRKKKEIRERISSHERALAQKVDHLETQPLSRIPKLD